MKAKTTEITAGMRWHDDRGCIRVMAVAEGYAMCRRPGAMPFIKSVKEIVELTKTAQAAPNDKPGPLV